MLLIEPWQHTHKVLLTNVLPMLLRVLLQILIHITLQHMCSNIMLQQL